VHVVDRAHTADSVSRSGRSTRATGARPDVALITEGTYPCGGGGVSVWCDQLIRGLPDVDFHVVALTLTDRDRIIWDRPANLVTRRRIGVWDRARERLDRGRRQALPAALVHLIRFLVGPSFTSLDSEVAAFDVLLDDLLDLVASDALGAHLNFDSFFEPVLDELSRSPRMRARYEMTLADSLTVANVLAHVLVPLTVDPGPVDVVHATGNGLPALVGLGAKARRDTPFMMAEHGLYLRERYLAAGSELERPLVKDIVLRFLRLMAAVAVRRADLLAPAAAFNGRWQRALGAPPERIQVLPNGVDPDVFKLRTAEVDRPDVAWLGRIDPIKDLHTLIRCAALVRDEMPEARFRLFGEEPKGSKGYLNSCLDLIEDLDLESVVTFEGRVESPVDAFHAGQFSVLSSITEGFPYSVLESMSCGVPVVGTAVGGVAEAIADTGMVVPPRNPAAMAGACLTMLRSGEDRRRMGIAARERVERLFSLEQMLEGHDLIYRRWADRTAEVIDLRDGATVGALGASLPPAVIA
jgi:polysaccharide biosynthesis protein PelF